jgi:aminoglycoside phosphotransferase (APT) family kinase protein
LEAFGQSFSAYSQRDPDIFTLVHIDYRLDNMMFGGPYPVAIVDWSPSLGSGAADAAYFMGTGMDAYLRQPDERHLLKEYHDRLVAYGIDNYDFDACWRDYRHNSFAGLVMAVIASMIVGQTERGDEMFMTMLSRSADMAIDLEGLAVLKP